MYYNPETKNLKELFDISVEFNASIPSNAEEVFGYFLVHDGDMPECDETHRIVNDGIIERDGKYFQTYRLEEIPKSEIDYNRIAELKRKLAETDYIALKIAEGSATRKEYAEKIAQRQTWRNEINDLESSQETEQETEVNESEEETENA